MHTYASHDLPNDTSNWIYKILREREIYSNEIFTLPLRVKPIYELPPLYSWLCVTSLIVWPHFTIAFRLALNVCAFLRRHSFANNLPHSLARSFTHFLSHSFACSSLIFVTKTTFSRSSIGRHCFNFKCSQSQFGSCTCCVLRDCGISHESSDTKRKPRIKDRTSRKAGFLFIQCFDSDTFRMVETHTKLNIHYLFTHFWLFR